MAKSVTLNNGKCWSSQAGALAHFKAMLGRYADDEEVANREDHEDLVALLARYDEAHAGGPSKTGPGIECFFRRRNVGVGYSTPSFWVRRTDGTETDFSYIWAVKGVPKSQGSEFNDACRAAVQADLLAAKRAAFDEHGDAAGCIPCEVTGVPVTFEAAHLDHAWPAFGQIVASFRAARGWTSEVPDGVLTKPADNQTTTTFADANVKSAFRDMHHAVAVLRIVDGKANLARAAGQRKPKVRHPIGLK
jgi:hypothetical protein